MLKDVSYQELECEKEIQIRALRRCNEGKGNLPIVDRTNSFIADNISTGFLQSAVLLLRRARAQNSDMDV